MWEKNAKKVADEYGMYVNWEERFYICPECGEPVYEDDWSEGELLLNICPICAFDDEEEEY